MSSKHDGPAPILGGFMLRLSTKYVFLHSLSLSGKAGLVWFGGCRVVLKARRGAKREGGYAE